MKIVSLFSGVGGLDLGFIKQGFEVVWANDFDKAACETYRKNLGDHIIHKDITQIHIDKIPDCDIVIGGSPCQGFSNANRRTNFLDNPKNFLVREFIRVVKGKKPKVFVLENVQQIMSAGDGRFVNEIKAALKEYHIEVKILDAADYGTPQHRKRAIFIGSKIGKIMHPEFKINIATTVKVAFEGLHNNIPNQTDFTKSKEQIKKRFEYVEQGQNWKAIPEFRDKNKHSNLYRRLDEDKPSITIPHAGKSLILHPKENRILSIRECARLQSFPDDFVFYGGLTKMYQQTANAVPPLLAEAVAKEIKEYVCKLEHQVS